MSRTSRSSWLWSAGRQRQGQPFRLGWTVGLQDRNEIDRSNERRRRSPVAPRAARRSGECVQSGHIPGGGCRARIEKDLQVGSSQLVGRRGNAVARTTRCVALHRNENESRLNEAFLDAAFGPLTGTWAGVLAAAASSGDGRRGRTDSWNPGGRLRRVWDSGVSVSAAACNERQGRDSDGKPEHHRSVKGKIRATFRARRIP